MKREPRLQFSDADLAEPKLEKPIKQVKKAAAKADKAQAKIPKKTVVKKERGFDPATGKVKTQLRFEEVDKKKPPSKLTHAVRDAPANFVLSQVHREVAQSEDDNVGVEAAHKVEQTVESGGRLLGVPGWEQAQEDGRVKLVLNPGLTFGTGSHATTRLCLQALEQHIHGGEKVLDLGCGSGILSIAALLLGAKDAFACDIDDKCVGVAYENAALNGVGKEHYTVRAGDVLSDKRLQKEFGGDYDVIVANIVADVIIALAPQVGKLLKKGGVFLCSGIIDDRADEVKEQLIAAGWQIEETRSSEGWFSYLCR